MAGDFFISPTKSSSLQNRPEWGIIKYVTLELNTVAIYILGAALVAALAFIIRLEVRINRLLRGRNAHSLEETIIDMAKEIDRAQIKEDKVDQIIANMEARLRQAIRRVETVRFDPFAEQGGKQSFTTALLNEEGNGLILSGLYSRDKVNVYAKPIRAHQSEFELCREEAEVLERAKC